MQLRVRPVLVVLALALGVCLIDSALEAGSQPEVTSLIEGRETQENRSTLVVLGNKLTKFQTFELTDTEGTDAGAVELALKSKTMLVLHLPEELERGEYVLTLHSKKSSASHDFFFTDGGVLPGKITYECFNTAVCEDLSDAESLEGHEASYFVDAGNVSSGQLSTDRFSAFSDFVAEGSIGLGLTQSGNTVAVSFAGSGASSQAARSDHDHDDVYDRTPTGSIMPYAGTTAPAGWLLCDGTSYHQSTYPELFAVIGTSFGTEYTGFFNVPDLRGRFLRGCDNAAGRDPDAAARTAMSLGGNEGDLVGSVQGDLMQDHTHLDSGHGHETDSIGHNGYPDGSADRTDYYYYMHNTRTSKTLNLPVLTGRAALGSPTPAGGNTPRVGSETRPMNAAVNFIIKY